MGVLLENLYKMPCFQNTRVVAGRIHNKEIYVEGITIIEAPDIANWIRGGELLLTSFYSIDKDLEIQKEIVSKLSQKGAATLIIKTSRFLSEIPKEIIELGNQLDFPIIEMPGHVKYIDIMYPVMAEIFNDQVNRLNYYKACHERFTDITLRMKGIPSIAQTLEELVKNPVIIFDNKFNPIVCNDEKYKDIEIQVDNLKQLVRDNYPIYHTEVKMANNTDSKYLMITEPIEVLDQIKAYIGIIELNDKIEDMCFIALESAATALRFEMLKEIAITEVGLKYKGDLMDDILNGRFDSIDNIYSRSAIFGWNLERQFIVILLYISQYEEYIDNENDITKGPHLIREKIMKIVDRVSYYYTKDQIFYNRGDSIAILWPKNESEDLNLTYKRIKRFTQEIQEIVNVDIGQISITVGIGGLAEDPMEIQRSYGEALDAIEYGRKIQGEGSVIAYDELGIYKLLCSFDNKDKLKEFVHPNLLRLYEYDKDKNNELISTLEVYLKCNLNAVKTAEELFVHYKTVLYRLNRIKEITNLDLEDRNKMLEIEVGLKILRIIN
ncbi:PucR family transcriptional regulator [Tepidimicrobium xylanilyticum]|uniref:Purine catabolism regulatory protein n=1 Tax=Tepidimicrobium xylanilyticum TaxID=1123352 RepID=A0A1H3A4K0_9FIRM|nr:PucR family transcriptional regulator ligand-binding domain-containing protein [Tepidimicrobium xylanilyticum]SDX23859.1 purine catabolism regulatory protein [Tepidimicrobium xylanilyticum]